MSSVTNRFISKLKAALASEKARTDLNGFLKEKVLSDADLISCFRLYLSGVTEGRRAKFDSDTHQRDRAIGEALWSRTIDLALDLNGFADLALFTASTARSEPADKRAKFHPPRELTDLPGLFFHWDDLAFTNPVDPRPSIEEKSQKKRQEILDARGVIAPLIDAYRERNGASPTLKDLLEFGYDDSTLRKEFDEKVAACNKLWRQYNSRNSNPVKPSDANLKEFDAAFESFSNFVGEHSDPLVFFQVLKWTRDLNREEVKTVGRRVERSKPLWTPAWQELYLEASFRGVRLAITEWNVLAVQKAKKLTGDDELFFLAPLPPEDQPKLQLRLQWGMKNIKEFTDCNTTRRRLGRFADYSSLELLDEFETVDLENHIATLVAKSGDKAAKRFVQVASTYAAFRDKYHVGQDVLDAFTIVWIEEKNGETSVIVEFHNMNYALFRTNDNGLERLVRDAFWRKMAEIAEQVQQFMLAYLQAIGLLVDVVTAIASAGTAGGFRQMATAFIRDKLQDKATDEVLDAFHIENKAVRVVAGIAVSVGTSLVVNRATKVDALANSLDNRGTHIDVAKQRIEATGVLDDAVGTRIVPDVPQSALARVEKAGTKAATRRRYAIIEDGQPKLVTESERNAIESTQPKAKPFMEDVLARYIVPVKYSATGSKSWFREVYVGAGSRQDFRDDLTKILKLEPKGPLSKALLQDGKLLRGGEKGQDAIYWAEHPELIQAGHVLSDNSGGPELLIVMSTHHNQKFSNNLESGAAGVGKPGQLLVEDAYVIQGVAVHRGTAHDLLREGLLDEEVVQKAEIIRFVD